MYNKPTGEVTKSVSIPNFKKIFANLGHLKNYFFLQIKRRSHSVHVELQRSVFHVWTVTAWFAGKFRLFYEFSKIHSVIVIDFCSIDPYSMRSLPNRI
jgi:hypothetical protein